MSKILQEKALLVRLSLPSYSGRKEDKAAKAIVTREIGIAEKSIKAITYLMPEYVSEVQSKIGRLRNWHYSVTLPWGRGVDIVPIKMYFEYVQKFGKMKDEIHYSVENFIDHLPEAIERDKYLRKGLFKGADYPTAEELRRKFKVAVNFEPVPSRDDFRVNLQNEEIEKIQNMLEESLKEKEKEAMRDLWVRLYEPVKAMAETLNSGKKGFHRTLVGNVENMCQLLTKLNFTEDPDLEEKRKKVEDELTRYSSEDLKNNEDLAKSVGKKAEDILKDMEGYI